MVDAIDKQDITSYFLEKASSIFTEFHITYQFFEDSLKITKGLKKYQLIFSDTVLKNLKQEQEIITCVFYTFNYLNLSHFEKSFLTFLDFCINKNTLISRNDNGYYDIRYNSQEYIKASEKYEIYPFEKEQFMYFSETISTRKDKDVFKKLMGDLVDSISQIPNICVYKAEQSELSESFYITLKYTHKKTKKKLKLSVRNHPLHTKAQISFNFADYNSIDEMKQVIILYLKNFDWSKKIDYNSCFLVKKESVYLEKIENIFKQGYDEEQRDFIGYTKSWRKTNNRGLSFV